MWTAACLSSGCFDAGQKAGEVTAFTPRAGGGASVPSAVPSCEPAWPQSISPPQCMAMKAWERPTSVLACTGTMTAPRRLSTAPGFAFGEPAALHVLRVQLHAGFGRVAEEAAQGAGAAHAVPLVAQAAGGEAERMAALRGSATGFQAAAAKRARPSGVGKTPSS